MPLGATMSAPGLGLGQRDAPVQLDGRVVLDLAIGPEHPAMTVVGVLVEAEVGHQDELVADGVAQGPEGALDDAVGVVGLGPRGILRRRHAEEDQAGDAERHQTLGLDDERVDGVLGLTGHGRDRCRLVDPLAHEERGNQVVHAQTCLGDQPAERRRATEPPQSAVWERQPDSWHTSLMNGICSARDPR